MYGELIEKGLAIALLLSLLLPYPVTQLLAAGFGAGDRKKHWRIIWLILLIVNLGLNTAATGFLYSRFSMAENPRYRLIQILHLECAYQDGALRRMAFGDPDGEQHEPAGGASSSAG